MNKLLKYPLRISAMLLLLTHSLYSNNDSLGTKKGSFYVFANAGVPVYNRLQIGYNKDHLHTVSSKPKLQYNAGFIFQKNRLVIGVLLNFMTFEFTGNTFEEYIPVDYNGPHGSPSSYNKYRIYQKVKNQMYTTALSVGINIIQKKRHTCSMNALFHVNAYQKTTIGNYYANEQLGYDTTKYTLAKNNISTSKLTEAFFFSLLLNYTYKLNHKISLDFSLQLLHPFYKGGGIVDNQIVKGASYEYDSYLYNYYKHFILTPLLGLKYKI